MSNQNGPRDVGTCIDSRYWLTAKGWAATEAIRAADGEDES